MPRARRTERPSRTAKSREPLRTGFGVGAIRLVPNLYAAQTQPGFEGVAWSEIAARLGVQAGSAVMSGANAEPRKSREDSHLGAHEVARRLVPDRAGMTIFSAPRPDPLAQIRTAEDIFAIVAHRRGLDNGKAALENVRAATRHAPFVSEALAARVRMLPGSRAGRRLHFRVVARMAGEHDFRRVDFARAVELGLGERGDHVWRRGDEGAADVEFWAALLSDEFILSVRLNDDSMRHREYKAAQIPASLRPAAAAALAWISHPEPDDVFFDPMCGAGTVLIERAHLGRYKLLLGSDHDPASLAAARTNIGPRYKPVELHRWDATKIPLNDASVDKLVTNLPWGGTHGTHENNRALYPRLFDQFSRVLRKGGTMVVLTGEMQLMRTLIAGGTVSPQKVLHVSILGSPAAIYVCRV
jgi:tRNA (guanine6-N2)-methyltransferase